MTEIQKKSRTRPLTLAYVEKNSYLCSGFEKHSLQIKQTEMKTTQEYISTLKQHAPILRERFGMTSMSLFGSVARGEQTEDSDVDVFVEMPVTLRGVGGANDYLEQITGRHVDMIIKHRNLTPFFLQEVERDGIRIF